VILQGTVGPRIINDNVVVARGTTLVLNGTTIKSDVRIRSGASLFANGAWVDGSVLGYRCVKVDLRGSTRVTWNVRATGSRSILLRSGTRVGGHVQIRTGSAPDGVDSLLVRNSAIEGDVRSFKSAGRLRVMDNEIKGKLKFVENSRGRYAIHNNEVFKSLLFLRNLGSASILDNKVGGDLICTGNEQLPRVRRNEVRGDQIIR